MQRFTLIAVDPEGNRREWPLSESTYVVGREPAEGGETSIAVPGDRHLSREHFRLSVHSEKVGVERCESGRNPLYFNGDQCELFALRAGQVFYTGKTQFGIVLDRDATGTTHYTLAHKAKEEARLRRLEDCFSAVLELLGALRRQTGLPAWQVSFPVIRTILPEVSSVSFLQVHGDSGLHRVIDCDPAQAIVSLDSEALRQALDSGETVTTVSEDVDLPQSSDRTLNPSQSWTIVTPVAGLEDAQYLLCVSGTGSLSRQALVERATLVDLVSEMVGHHIVIQQGSEYSNLLGVFGHHIGTLFKTSGALQLWSDPQTSPEVKQVLGHLLPVWGISQAISLHKKRGEKAHKELLRHWVKKPQVEEELLQESLVSLISHVYHSLPEEPYFLWTLNGTPIPEFRGLHSLPPLDDVPQIFDKTLALTVGLLELLNNVRKYPGAHGSGREDRKDLQHLSPAEKIVELLCKVENRSLLVEIVQPVVTAADGSIPRSRSLERIRALEQSLLGGLVGTLPETMEGPTSAPHVVLVKHRWAYHYGQLLDDWGAYYGA